jgi:drug/metabolite transporter (DMT)-like permease
MLLLIFRILFLNPFGLMIKHCHSSGKSLLSIGAINYAVAAAVIVFSAGYRNGFVSSFLMCVIGILAGIAYFISYSFMIRAVGKSGISIAFAVVGLSVLIAILFLIFYWQERPNVYQILGIAFVCISLPLLSIKRNDDAGIGKDRLSWLILALFFAAGGTGLAAKAFSEFGVESQREIYLLFLFGTAMVFTLGAASAAETPPKPRDIPLGILLGLFSLGSAYFLIRSLMTIPGMVVFPIAGFMVTTTLGGVAIWREKLRKITIVGLFFAIIAVILASIKS